LDKETLGTAAVTNLLKLAEFLPTSVTVTVRCYETADYNRAPTIAQEKSVNLRIYEPAPLINQGVCAPPVPGPRPEDPSGSEWVIGAGHLSRFFNQSIFNKNHLSILACNL